MEAGKIAVPSGTLWAGNLHSTDTRDGASTSVPSGTYRVQVKGMAFKGHRRPARLRAFLSAGAEPGLGKRIGEAISDCGLLAIYDIAAFRKIVGRKHLDEFWTSAQMATMEDVVGCFSHDYSGKSLDMAFTPSGLGDGSFPVYVLKSGSAIVGMEIEMLPPGYSVTISHG